MAHEKPVKVPFHYIKAYTLSGGATSENVAPASFPRLGTIADGYALYRFTELKYRIVPDSTITARQTACYIPGAVDTPPSSSSQASEILEAVCLGTRQTTPSDWGKCQPRDLTSYLPWYKTVVGSPDPIVEIQGALFMVGTGTEQVVVEYRGICEFKNPIDTASTPQLRQEKLLAMERERLLRILASGGPTSSTAQVGLNSARGSVPSSALRP